jgi:CTP:molybdopterin cytidylyltransferase MocA
MTGAPLTDDTVAGLLLAAGKGRRFGRPKALVELGGQLLVERGVDLLAAGGTSPVFVVIGAGASEVLASADLSRATVVHNNDWPTGMGSSLRAGLAAVNQLAPAEAGAVVVALVDQPDLAPEAVRRLVAAYRAGAVAAVATYRGAPRNPVLLARPVWDAVAAEAEGEVGARAFLRANPDLVTPVPCEDVGSPYDIDTQSDLERMSCRPRPGFG